MTGIANAIANRDSEHCWIPVIGDSVTGPRQGATALANGWPNQASSLLRTMYPTNANGSNGGIGYLNMDSTSPALTYTWPVSLVSQSGWSSTPLGPVRHGWSMAGPGSWSWNTPSSTTSIRVMFYATGGGGQLQVTGGSGGPVTITDSVAGTDGALSVSIPVAGAQVITIAQVSGGVYISGVIHYAGDEGNGITIHGCGHYGWSAASWPGSQGFSGFPFDPSVAALCNSSALGFFLGINDCQAVSAATFQANLTALISELQGFSPLGSVPLIFVIPYAPNVSIVDGGGWPAYVTAIENVAGNYSGSTVVNLAANMPPVASGGSLYVDTVHPSDSGHALIAQIFAAAMPLPASGSGGATVPARTLRASATLAFPGAGGVTVPARTLAAAGAAFAPPAPAVIWRPAYCNRTEAQGSLDFPPGTDVNGKVDRALMDAAENIEGGLKRVFYPSDDTRFWDWPQQGGAGPGGGTPADPWRLVLDDNDLVCLASLVAGGVTLGLDQLFLVPWGNPAKFRPYYSVIEVDRSTSASFGNQQQTPQNALALTATWGYGADADPVGRLASAVGLGDPAVTLTSGAVAGPGDVLVLGYGRGPAPFPGSAPHAGAVRPYLGERVLVTGVLPVETGLTQSGAGVTSAEDSDQSLSWTGTGALAAGEVITLDAEDMFVEKVLGGVAVVRRAFNGTTLAGHSGAAIWAMRQYSVLRGQLGTAAGAYPAGAMVHRHRVPQLIRDLAIAEAANQLLQEGTGYARVTGSGENAAPAPGIALVDKWAEARARHGRGGKARQRAV